MPQVDKTATVPYTPEQMFDLVNDVASYPQFLPWCQSSQINSIDKNTVAASLVFAAGPFSKSFTTCNSLQRPNKIGLQLSDGPFNTLAGEWLFEATDEGCNVSLSLNFTYANRLAENAIGLIFEQAVEKMLPCFVQRAEEVYGD